MSWSTQNCSARKTMDLQIDIEFPNERKGCEGNPGAILFRRDAQRSASSVTKAALRCASRRNGAALRMAALPSVLLALLTGCAPRITPPISPPNPVTVIVADYGRHTSLFLPGKDDGLVEFAWGDYEWFARGRTGTWRALSALFWSDGSTLGIRRYTGSVTDENLLKLTGAQRLLRFAVSQDDVIPLRNRLIAAIDASRDKAIHNEVNQMDFVPDGRHYWFADNCNHRTAQWLRDLGCEVDGLILYSNFELKE